MIHKRIVFGPWRPDASPLSNDEGLQDVRNAIPARGHWLPQRSLLTATDHDIIAPVQALFTAARLSGDLELFVGFGGALYRVPSRTLALVDVTNASDTYSTAASARWQIVQFGDTLVGTNFDDPPQAYDLIGGGNFVDLSVNAPRAKYIAVVRDRVVLAYTATEADGTNAYQVRWHGFTNGLPDITNWTPDVASGADFQALSDIGQINGITGGEWGTIVGEQGVVRMTEGPIVYQFDTVERRLGTRVPRSVTQYRQITFWWSPEGWCAFDGGSVRMIGTEKVDRWFSTDFDEGRADLMWTAVENGTGHILWAYCGQGHNNKPNRLLRYSPQLDEWSASDIEVDALATGKTFALTLDDPFFANLDNFTGNLDDPSLWTSLPQTMAVTNSRISSFSGPVLIGRFETGEFAMDHERRSILQKAMVLQDSGSAIVEVFKREKWTSVGGWGGRRGQRTDGWHRFREPGRTHRVRVTMEGNWKAAVGIDVYADPRGRR